MKIVEKKPGEKADSAEEAYSEEESSARRGIRLVDPVVVDQHAQGVRGSVVEPGDPLSGELDAGGNEQEHGSQGCREPPSECLHGYRRYGRIPSLLNWSEALISARGSTLTGSGSVWGIIAGIRRAAGEPFLARNARICSATTMGRSEGSGCLLRGKITSSESVMFLCSW